ncbi:MAG: PD40 domain-containing protein [Bacteroidetes bacterium]|nr:PD40 domain-containing protein [Bacteroidota bacterium]
MRLLYLSLLIAFLLTISASGQKERKFKEKFVEAESYILYEEYNEALPGYLDLLKIYPQNDNYNYRIGQCYLNTPGQKDKAIEYLEKAILNTNDKYKVGSFKEIQAPVDAYYFLANAYRVNKQIDKALEIYSIFKKLLDPKIYDSVVVNKQIESCYNAKKLQQNPLFLKYTNLGEPINTRFSDYNPVVSGDDTKMVFTRALQFFDGVFFSEKVNGTWSNPIDLSFQLGVDEDLYPCALSWDGTTLYLYKLDNYVGNIYISHYSNGMWSRVEKLNENINDKYWESHACVTKDENTMYFTSNRKGTYGGLDIYRSEKDSLGEWGPAVNLGPNINTEYNEETPFITEDGQTLFFSSYGHFNTGGYDILYSTLLDSAKWSKPLNMGYPINTPDDDLFYAPAKDGNFAYYSQFTDEGMGERDIFLLEIFPEEHPRKFMLSGIVSIKDIKWKIDETFRVYVVSYPAGDTIAVVKPNMETGEYFVDVSAGDYELIFSGKNLEKTSELISMSANQENEKIQIPSVELIPLDLIADFEVPDTSFVVTDNKPLLLQLETENNSRLIVQYFQDSLLQKVDTFYIRDTLFAYKAIPLEGDNQLKFTLTDQFGNQTIKETEISFNPPVKKPVADLISESQKEEPPGELIDLLETLKNLAESDGLIAVLEDINLKDQEIGTSEELFEYLAKQSISKNELKEIVTVGANNGIIKIEDFRNFVAVNTEKDMSNIIHEVDLQKENISTPDELMQYLTEKTAISSVFTEEEVKSIFITDELHNRDILIAFKESLTKYAFGDLKEILDTLRIPSPEIQTSSQLYEYLSRQVERKKIKEKDLQLLLYSIALNGNPEIKNLYNKLLIESDGELKSFLQTLNPEEIKITDSGGFIEYLLQKSSTEKFTREDVVNMIAKIISGSQLDEEKITGYISLTKEKARNARRRIAWGLSLVLVAFIFFYIQRKKKHKE